MKLDMGLMDITLGETCKSCAVMQLCSYAVGIQNVISLRYAQWSLIIKISERSEESLTASIQTA